MTPHSLALTLTILLATTNTPATPLSGIDHSHFDPQTRIQDDLFGAVNGHWLLTAQIPADQSSFGASDQLRDLSEQRSKALIKQAIQRADPSPDEQKIGDLYRSFMDEEALERQGLRPLLADLRQIAAIDNRAALTRYLGEQQSMKLNLPLTLSLAADARQPQTNLLQASQSGLGLPSRESYLQTDAAAVALRRAYLRYLKTLFTLAGCTDGLARAQRVMALETRLAQAQWSVQDNRSVQKTYNKMTLAALQRQTPGLQWDRLLRAARLSSALELNLRQPDYFRQLALLLQHAALADWREYLSARLLHAYAPYLSRSWTQAHFAYYQALSGAQSLRPRWKRGVGLVESGMGEALGKLYVARYFSPAAKASIDSLVAHLFSAFRQRLDSLEWMSPETRAQARAKLDNYRIKIAYPERWRDFSQLAIRPDDLIGNLRMLKTFYYQDMLDKLYQAPRRDEWFMTPQTVNAYYHPQLNEIVFPAALLQPPFYNPQADDAVNYGGIGAVIGHEISHGFDDQGSQYDESGQLRDWWQAADRQRFQALAARMVSQYSAFQPLPGQHLNGELTLGENIADNVGLELAWQAYQRSLGGRVAPVIDGMSGAQRFFIGFAQVRRAKVHEALLRHQLTHSPHPPARFRTNGTVMNLDAFYQAFDVKPGDGMYRPPQQRIRMW
jgi:putative endopeptidase